MKHSSDWGPTEGWVDVERTGKKISQPILLTPSKRTVSVSFNSR